MSRIATDLTSAVRDSLQEAGLSGDIQDMVPVGGGDINEAALIETNEQRFFVKWNYDAPFNMFDMEAYGLRLLAQTGTVRVPGVITVGEAQQRGRFIILEWIDRGERTEITAALLGNQLASLHSVAQPRYGLENANFIGQLPQENDFSDTWIDFFRERRLGVQKQLADQRGLLPSHRARRLERLMGTLDKWIDETQCSPSLLHGDLWSGNWMADSTTQPVVFDPAVYAGDREVEIAMTTLFGRFPRRFYDSYNEVFALAEGYEERLPIYQLYYLMVHLNTFGEQYGSAVDDILIRYTYD